MLICLHVAHFQELVRRGSTAELEVSLGDSSKDETTSRLTTEQHAVAAPFI